MVCAAWGLSDYLGHRRRHSKAVSGRERESGPERAPRGPAAETRAASGPTAVPGRQWPPWHVPWAPRLRGGAPDGRSSAPKGAEGGHLGAPGLQQRVAPDAGSRSSAQVKNPRTLRCSIFAWEPKAGISWTWFECCGLIFICVFPTRFFLFMCLKTLWD